MDVFGYGTEEGTRPLLPPGTCWICENSPQQEAMKVIDTRRNSRPENRGQSERKYVCEPCAKELGAAVGQVSAEEYETLAKTSEQHSITAENMRAAWESASAQQTRVVEADAIFAYLEELKNAPSNTASALVPPATEE